MALLKEIKTQTTVAGSYITVNAPSKINLTLLIKGKRSDGFHEVETLMSKINWYDRLIINKSQQKGIKLHCKGPHWAPEGEDNLVLKACRLLCEKANIEPNLEIELYKNIPAGTGLGSASSDAAATLIGLNELLSLKMSKKKLYESAARLGSDVPFFLNGPAAICTGRGEKIKKFPKKLDFFALLVLPDVNVSTKKVYNGYRHNKKLYNNLKSKTDDLLKMNKIFEIAELYPNMLSESCFEQFEKIKELKEKLEKQGVKPLCLSGSGSALYCLTQHKDKALKWQNKVNGLLGCESVIVRNNRW